MEQLNLIPITVETIKPKDHWVTKSNALVEGHYRLSMIQQKIVITMASLVQPEDEDFKWYRLNIKHFADILGGHNHDYKEMVASIHHLMEKVVTIFIDGERFLKTHWIQSAMGVIVGGNYVDVSFDPRLKPFFLHLKEQFTTYKLKNVMTLKSSYSIRIYELLKQYQNLGKRVLTIGALRNMLGIEPKEYERYNDFKRKVILVAHREVNEKTDIRFDFKEMKLGRKVHELEFVIQKKTEPSSADKLKEKEERRQDREAKKKTERRAKVEAYLGKLSPDELAELTAQAREMVQQDGSAFMKDREIPEPMLRGYLHTLAENRLKKGKSA